MTNLPQGWEVKTIEEVCKNSSSNLALKDIKDKNGDYPVFGASGIVSYVDFYHKDKECLAIVKDGSIGKVFLLPSKSSVIGTLNYLENFENTNLKYLFYFLHNIDFSKYILGSAIPHIYFRDYKKEQIPLPPLKEQERIVGILDFAFSKIDENIKKAKENLANIDELMQSALQKAFNPLNDDTKENYQLPQSWEWKSLGEIGNTSSGGTPLRNKKEYWENGSIKWLKSGELNDGYIDFIEENITEEAIENSSAKIFQKGTLLIAMYGATAGRLGILNLDSATNQAVCAFLHKDNKNIKFLEKFLFYFLFFIRDKIIKDSFGGAQPNISQTYIKNLQIPLPPLQEQEQIAKHLDFVFEKAKALKELYTKELKDYEELKQSLLDKAFKGEL
ncbi:TPA: restriction endonuclease subunit S [Campylobacter jejuni]|nr:restriction endonuclease subunit S [Campylobacter jejuni]